MQQTIELDDYAGRPYFLSIRGEPDLESPDDFGVTLYYKDPEKEKQVEVAKIDNAHGQSHLHKYFLDDEPEEALDLSVWEAVEHIIEHHPEYARRHRNKTR